MVAVQKFSKEKGKSGKGRTVATSACWEVKVNNRYLGVRCSRKNQDSRVSKQILMQLHVEARKLGIYT